MPVQHTVVFRLRHEPGSTAETAFLDHAKRVLAAIDGVEDFRIARQVSPKSDLAWQFSMRFADDSAYAAYDASAPHRRFVDERWATEVEAFQEYDFEER